MQQKRKKTDHLSRKVQDDVQLQEKSSATPKTISCTWHKTIHISTYFYIFLDPFLSYNTMNLASIQNAGHPNNNITGTYKWQGLKFKPENNQRSTWIVRHRRFYASSSLSTQSNKSFNPEWEDFIKLKLDLYKQQGTCTHFNSKDALKQWNFIPISLTVKHYLIMHEQHLSLQSILNYKQNMSQCTMPKVFLIEVTSQIRQAKYKLILLACRSKKISFKAACQHVHIYTGWKL